jgi:hypothetical protein
MRLALAALLATVATPAFAETLFCAPVAVAELIGEPGPMTISASDPSLGKPLVFWLDTETGVFKEHFDEGTTFITREAAFEIVSPGGKGKDFVARDPEQDELYTIDIVHKVHAFRRTVGDALTAIGTRVPGVMEKFPAEADAPIWPFPYEPN